MVKLLERLSQISTIIAAFCMVLPIAAVPVARGDEDEVGGGGCPCRNMTGQQLEDCMAQYAIEPACDDLRAACSTCNVTCVGLPVGACIGSCLPAATPACGHCNCKDNKPIGATACVCN